MKNLTTLKKLPGVMAFRRGHIVSDAEMFNLFDEKPESPVLVFRHGIRGVQNINEGKGNTEPWKKASKTGAAGERSVANIQVTDSAKLDSDATGMLVRFEMRFLDIEDLLDSCASVDKDNQKMARETISDFLKRAKACAVVAKQFNGIRYRDICLRKIFQQKRGRKEKNRQFSGCIGYAEEDFRQLFD